MDMTPKEYQAYVKQKAPKSPIVKNTLLAFLVGGEHCLRRGADAARRVKNA